MATKRTKRASSPFGLDQTSGLPLVPSDARPSGRRARRVVAGTLDTALLVLVGLVALALVWWLLAAVIGTILFFVKLAALALVIALLLRVWWWVRRRR